MLHSGALLIALPQEPAMNPHHYAETHEVFNQVPPLDGANLYRLDLPLQEWIRRYHGSWGETRLNAYGALAGGPLMAAGFLANEHKPELRTHDRYGHRIDQVDFHPAYHQLMHTAIEHGLPSLPWTEPRDGAHVVRAGLTYLHSQVEAASGCPLTMTFASVPALKVQPDIAEQWLPKILATTYDPRNVPMEQKAGVTIGMAMTEKQGGTDVRANTTRAYPVGASGPGQAYELVGHKWFCSAPMCDAFLTLAQTDKGLSCFLLPRHRPDGTRNQFYIQRLKNKLGNWANASSEVEYRGALAWMLGEEGRGVPTIIEMVAMTRFDCMVGSSALMRQALIQATHHCAHRKVGGKLLIDQPLMQNVLGDLALESEAALALTMRMGRALDHPRDAHEAKFARLVTAIGKYWICKRAPEMIYEASECLGGAGYVEETILPRLYREAPVNSIWEGSGNVQCLDVLRALSKEPGVLDALFHELGDGHGDARLKGHIERLKAGFMDTADIQFRARQLTEDTAIALQATLLLQAGNATVSDAFIASRLEGHGRVYGTLPRGVDVDTLVMRSAPHAE
jgi:putative acyl-CoA dehydrogenase